ncbi:MAG: ABC transporter substrate-binding protein [Candidatus Rokubacteria bacterium]|nr:ABC transporter substrate-binding protein [Candidatus Rokubacteria bacterium]
MKGLSDLGRVEGQSIFIEWRYAEGKVERLPALAAELVSLKVDVLVASAAPASLAAKRVTSTIPIVSVYTADPVGLGLVESLARPGGNVTGISALARDYTGKMLELLGEARPRLRRVAVLGDAENPTYEVYLKELQPAAQRLRLTLQPVEVRGPGELDKAFLMMTKGEKPDGVFVMHQPFTFVHRKRIVELAAKTRMPAVYGSREYAQDGGLIGYGASIPDIYRRAATYVDKILKGARPADLPVEQPTRFELVVNLKTAKALGLTIPQSVLIRADEVIR